MGNYFNERFSEIKKMYDDLLPIWEEEYRRNGNMHQNPYVRNWLTEFTPIENFVWSDIRKYGLPFYPQIPVSTFFLDFACPMKKIAIECDGKEFHNGSKDSLRDKELGELGWSVFRLEGHECNRTLEDPWLLEEDTYEYCEILHPWFQSTSSGVLYSIKKRYFSKDLDGFAVQYADAIDHTIDAHLTTPRINLPTALKEKVTGEISLK